MIMLYPRLMLSACVLNPATDSDYDNWICPIKQHAVFTLLLPVSHSWMLQLGQPILKRAFGKSPDSGSHQWWVYENNA